MLSLRCEFLQGCLSSLKPHFAKSYICACQHGLRVSPVYFVPSREVMVEKVYISFHWYVKYMENTEPFMRHHAKKISTTEFLVCSIAVWYSCFSDASGKPAPGENSVWQRCGSPGVSQSRNFIIGEESPLEDVCSPVEREGGGASTKVSSTLLRTQL